MMISRDSWKELSKAHLFSFFSREKTDFDEKDSLDTMGKLFEKTFNMFHQKEKKIIKELKLS